MFYPPTDALNIPPVFLGIGTLADLEAFLQACGTAQPQGKSPIHENEVSLYQDALELHWGMHYAGTLQDIPTIQRWSQRIELAASKYSVHQQSLEETVCEYYRLLDCWPQEIVEERYHFKGSPLRSPLVSSRQKPWAVSLPTPLWDNCSSERKLVSPAAKPLMS